MASYLICLIIFPFRLCLDPIGGLELDAFGNQKKKWNWKEQLEHVHAPPIQPITFSVSNQISVRVMSQENVVLTFATRNRSCRFQVGSHLKVISNLFIKMLI